MWGVDELITYHYLIAEVYRVVPAKVLPYEQFYRMSKAQQADLNRRVLGKEIDAWVWIGPGAFADKPIEYHARNVSNILTQAALRDEISAAESATAW